MTFDKTQFFAGAVVEREVTLADGTVATLHFQKPTAADVRRWAAAEKAGPESAEHFVGMQRLIACSLYDPEKKALALTGDDYQRLTYEACEILFPHVQEVAGLTRAAKKPSPSEEAIGSATS